MDKARDNDCKKRSTSPANEKDGSKMYYEFDLDADSFDDTIRKLSDILSIMNKKHLGQVEYGGAGNLLSASSPPTKRQKNNALSSSSFNDESTQLQSIESSKSAILKTKCQRKAICTALDELAQLRRQKEEEESGLFDSLSPFLSLGKSILSHVVSYLDEEGLYQCERSSFALCEIIHKGGHWSAPFAKTRFSSIRYHGKPFLAYGRENGASSRPIFRFEDTNDTVLGDKETISRYFGMLACKAVELESKAGLPLDSDGDEGDDDDDEEVGVIKLQPSTTTFVWNDPQLNANYGFLRLSRWDDKIGAHRMIWQAVVGLGISFSSEPLFGILKLTKECVKLVKEAGDNLHVTFLDATSKVIISTRACSNK